MPFLFRTLPVLSVCIWHIVCSICLCIAFFMFCLSTSVLMSVFCKLSDLSFRIWPVLTVCIRPGGANIVLSVCGTEQNSCSFYLPMMVAMITVAGGESCPNDWHYLTRSPCPLGHSQGQPGHSRKKYVWQNRVN